MTLQKMHKRGEAGRRGEVAARYAASHPFDGIVERGFRDIFGGRADVKPEPTSVPAKAVPSVVPVQPSIPVKPTVVVKPTTEPVAKPPVLPTSASAVTSKPPVSPASAPPVTSASVPTTSVPPTTTPPVSTPVTPTVSPTLARSPTPLPPNPLKGSVPVVSTPTHHATASAAGVSASTSTVPQPTAGLGVGSIIGIIAGVAGGLLVLGLVVSFFLRRLRTRTRGAFNADLFRNSAIMLKDDDNNEKDFRPRPPSMIERRNVATPVGSTNARANVPTPSMVYPYSDQGSVAPSAPADSYGQEHPRQYSQFGSSDDHYAPATAPPSGPHMYSALPGAYGIPPPMAPYGGAQYDQAGFGAPPMPGTYGPGAYASYGQDPRYQQYPQSQHQGYQQHMQYQQRSQAQQPMGYGNPAADLTRSESFSSNSALPNPFARSPASSPPLPSPSRLAPGPVSEKQILREAELKANSSSASGSSSSDSDSSSLARRPTQAGGAPPAYINDGDSASWASRRDQKRANEIVMVVSNSDTEARGVTTTKLAQATTPSTTQVPTVERPNSSLTMYGDESEAYGGI